MGNDFYIFLITFVADKTHPDYFVEKEGVDGGEDAAVVKVGVAGQLLDVLDGVAGCYAGTESGCANVDGVGTMIDGFATLFKVFGGREEFQLHGYSILKR